MSITQNQNAGSGTADAGSAGSPPADAGAARVSGAGTADAAGKTDSAEYWKAEAKKAFAARDSALEAYKASDEYKALISDLDARKAKEAEALAKQKADEEEAAKKRGEFEKLYQTTVTERDAARAEAKAKDDEIAKVRREASERYRRRVATEALERAYAAVGGFDLDTFRALVGDPLKQVKVSDEDAVEGAEAYVKDLREKRPHLFGSSTAERKTVTKPDPKNGNGSNQRPTGLASLRVR